MTDLESGEEAGLPASAVASARTNAYLARIAERKNRLRDTLREVVSPHKSMVWEVGCGHGHFLTAYAKANPETLCVGVDIVRDRIARAKRKANRTGLTHLHFVLAEANDFLSMLPESMRFSSIYVLFPDPWPKRRHHKNRLMQSAFLTAVGERAGQGTRLYFRTDFEPYFAEVAATLAAHALWERVDEPWPFEEQTVFQARAPLYHSLVAGRRR